MMKFQDTIQKIFGNFGIHAFDESSSEVGASAGDNANKDPWDMLQKAVEKGTNVTGIIGIRKKGGFLVDVDGVSAFLPCYLADANPVSDVDYPVGSELELRVRKADPNTGRVIVSRRDVLLNTRSSDREQRLSTIEEGQIVKGVVLNINNLGAFIDLGGIDGILHASEMPSDDLQDPSEIVSPGEEIEVRVLWVDRERARVSLGLKNWHPKPNPSPVIDDLPPVGTRLTGWVSYITDRGCYVDIGDGLEGFVRASDMNWTWKKIDPHMVVRIGDEVNVVVIAINKKTRRILLGIKQCQIDPWVDISSHCHTGDIITGRVAGIIDCGCFVEIEQGLFGFVYVSDIGWFNGKVNPYDVVKVGDIVQAKILIIDESKHSIRLSMKQCQPGPWGGIASRYHAGDRLTGKVSHITYYGCFVEIGKGIDGLVHVSQMDWIRKRLNPSEVVSIGDTVQVQILEIDEANHRISLGLKQCRSNPWEEFAAEHREGDMITGRIKTITVHGIFVTLERGIDGLVRPDEISWTVPGDEAMKGYKEGDEVQAVIMDIHADLQRVALSIRRLEEEPAVG